MGYKKVIIFIQRIKMLMLIKDSINFNKVSFITFFIKIKEFCLIIRVFFFKKKKNF